MKIDQDKPIEVKFVTVPEDNAGQRIDNYLLSQLKGVPKSAIYRIIRKGEVRANKKRVKPEYKLAAGDVVRIPPIRTAEREEINPHKSVIELIESRILLENKDIIVINKPCGVAVHGGSGVSYGVIEALRVSRGDGVFLELVHRLDRDTSGCLMIAKKRSVLKRLHEKLIAGDMNKIYLALVVGRWNGREHSVDAPLEKYTFGGERMVRVGREGKVSLTEFRLAEHLPGCTLVEASPITGRTHQIRVHAQFSGHPIAGDPKYALRDQNKLFQDVGLKRLFLHAHRLSVKGVSPGFDLDVTAPLDDELVAVLAALRQKSGDK